MRWFKRKPKKHEHRWEPIAIRIARSLPRTIFGGDGETPCTHILLRCACGAIQTQIVSEHWTLEEIRGGHPDATSAIEALTQGKPK